MDMKNYNVDDILLEIKARKMREKAQAEGQKVTRPAAPAPEFLKPGAGPARGISSAPVEEEFHLDFSIPEPKAKREPERAQAPEPKPVPKREPGRVQVPEPKPVPKREPERVQAPEPKPVPKREPERVQAPEPKPVPKRVPERIYEPEPDAAYAEENISERKPRKSLFKREPKPEPDAVREADTAAKAVSEFSFNPPDASVKKRNPLEFDGEVRSITERAKMRGSAAPGLRPSAQRFEFSAEPFHADAADAHTEDGMSLSSHDKTRVLPALSGIRDLKTGDFQKMDFGKLAAESQHGFYYEEDDEELVHEGAVIDYSEYNSTSDRRDVQHDIAHVKLWLFIRISLTVVLTVVLFVLTLSGKYEAIPLPEIMWPVSATMRVYLIACTVVTILIALVNSSTVGGGLMGLFRMHANSDTLASCAILAAIGQGVVLVANPQDADPAKLNLYFGVAALAMLFNAMGKMSMINRILANFRILASAHPKNAILAVESGEFCHEFIKDSARKPVIAHSVKADFFTDFLGLSYSDKYDVGINRAVAPVCLIGAVLVGVITYFLSGSDISAVSSLTAVLCVCAALSATFIENIPLAKLTKRLTPQGGMVSGTKAVEDFCDTRAVVLTENDLFPRGNVQLHGIKAFPSARVDEAILDAASVLCAMDGALGPVFLEMIGGNKRLLKKVDNIAFENNMGISAWVDSRRVLIGNRMLMQNHGITLPTEVLEQNQLMSESEPLFLSNSGEASAMFTVSYHVDEDLAVELDQLAHREKLLIVHTTDANITAEKIWEIYGYPAELIRILPAEWHKAYHQMSAPRDKAIAEIVYTGKAPAMVQALNSCITARSSILSATVIQLIQVILGYALVTFLGFMGSIDTLSVLQVCGYQMFWFILIFIVQKARQS